MGDQSDAITVSVNPEAGRYEARIGGVVAGFAEYRQIRRNPNDYLTACGHHLDGAVLEVRRHGYWRQARRLDTGESRYRAG